MNIKRIFGVLLTVVGIFGLIYAAVLLANTGGGMRDVKTIAIFGILGGVFFTAGMGLVRTMKDEV
ncbi:MAG: hypothetical protein IPL27_01315 [Lewinellaceae bacterium]|nr:hypothetical protein [Lewinellaceae bacterium]